MLTRLTSRNGNAVLPLEACKDYLRVTHSDEDAQIERLRDAAVAEVERVTGIALSQAEFRWTLPRFGGAIMLPVRPVIAVLAVTYESSEGPATYDEWRFVDGKVLPALSQCWPIARGAVTVDFSAGMLDADNAPELTSLVQRLLVHFYDNRLADVPPALMKAIVSHRQVLV